MSIEEFKIEIPEEEISNLRTKISLTRWPDELNTNKWALGTKLDFLQKLVKYWAKDFDWRKHEKQLNQIGSFKFTTSDGFKIHFLHSKSKNTGAIPLLMTHGWPGSIQEFIKIIPILNSGIDGISFDVVCPSIPGYGFSDKPKKFGMSSEKVAPLFHKLMINLGYEKYIAQGGDWGATISKWIAELYPENCIGLHLNLVPAFPPSNGNVTHDLSEEEIKGLENFEKYQKTGLGYYQIQMTKPQSLGYALNDSPVGLAGWIVEKFHSWTNDNLDRIVINDDEVLAIVSLYWFTQSITSSMRLYYENGIISFSPNYIETPTGGIIFDKEIVRPPKAWAKKIYNIVHWTNAEGGHFAAMENPETLANDIVSFTKEII
jgi:pimeloyl-ACP methyl ester carboxylesterase